MLASGTPPANDPYWANVVSLVYCDEAAGSTTLADQKGLVWTMEGTGGQTSVAQTLFGDPVLTTNGGSGRLTTPDAAVWSMGTGPWTYECWAYGNSFGTSGVFGQWDNGTGASRSIFVGTALGGTGFYANSASISSFPAGTPTTAAWHHWAFCRTGNVWSVYVDAVLKGTVTNAAALAEADRKFELNTQGFAFSGYISNFRVTAGVCRYTSAGFTLPSAKFPNS